MESQKITPGKFGMNYGLILGLVMIVIGVITYVTGLALKGAQWPQWIYYIVFPLTIIYAISQYKKSNGNLLSLGEAIKIGVVAGVISAIIYILYGLLFRYVIDPGFSDLMLEVVQDKMLADPKYTQEMVDQSMKFVEMMFNPFIGSAFWIAVSALFGLIYGLIGGLAMKKELE